MALLAVLFFCAGGIFCLAPVVLYLAWLGGLNRRPRPTVLPGAWDFVALLAGLSGFLVFGGGVVLAGLQSNARVVFRGNWKQIHEVWADERLVWLVLAGAYLVGMLIVVAVGTYLRSGSLAVYNIDRDAAEAAVDAAVAATGVPARRVGDVWQGRAGAVAEIRTFDGLRHLTVWLVAGDPAVRQEVERALRQQFAATRSDRDNAAAAWLGTATVGLTVTLVSFVLVIGYLVYVAR